MCERFHHISLISCQYKIISKILANWLSMMMGNLISDEEPTFINGLQILDDPIIMNDVMSLCEPRVIKLWCVR